MLMAKLVWSSHWRSLLLVFWIVALPLCRPAFAQAPSQGLDTTAAKSDAAMSFRVLKSLGGTWNGRVTTDPANPDIDGPIQVTIRVASRGNVLVHEIAPGGVQEPTMIYLDGNRLTLIHYCEAGNWPRLVARRSPDQKSVEFDFFDISGSTEPVYLNHFTFNIISADHHTEDWTFMLPDGTRLRAHFDLTRAKDSASPARK